MLFPNLGFPGKGKTRIENGSLARSKQETISSFQNILAADAGTAVTTYRCAPPGTTVSNG